MMDEAAFRRAARRILQTTLALGAACTLAALIAGGWRAGAGMLLGAAVSYANLRILKRAVDGIGATGGTPPPRARTAVMVGLRYLLLAGGAYVILVRFTISVPAVLTGLFVSAAAVVLEILYELVYARD